MYENLRLAAVAGCLLVLLAGCRGRAGEPTAAAPEPSAAAPEPAAAAPASANYTPKAVFCADGRSSLCGTMPSMIGPDPALPSSAVGYEGLSSDVQSFEQDAQTPFDNMSWQMFVALNTTNPAGRYVWQTYSRVESVFGPPPPAPFCQNPQNLPVFTLMTKSDGQPSSRDESFIQAATDKPLIDRNGNWTLYERRLNSIELMYLKNSQWDLTTLAGQQAFIQSGKKVDFTKGADVNPPTGTPGAIELKLAWRILDRTKGDDPSRYLTLNALLAVDKAEVRGGQPICATVQLGLVGFHIVQKNPTRGVLLPQWIWATFEHQDNAPLSPNACDPVTSMCYMQPNPTVCTAPANATGTYSYFNAACTNKGGPCPANTAPSLLSGEKEYLWSPQQPYAGPYRYDQKYGTQVARCYQIYSLTQQLNTQWRQKLQQAGSVLANYMLIGAQWGGKVEPRLGVYTNGAVPAFLSNSTLETYIQTDKLGTCIGCHSNAKMAYKSGATTYDANFSFLPGLAQ